MKDTQRNRKSSWISIDDVLDAMKKGHIKYVRKVKGMSNATAKDFRGHHF